MRDDLPTGTVTFLFTDVEGSTRLLDELGAERYAEALEEHRRVMRGVFAQHGGVEVDTQGDACFVAFPTAPGALGAAADARAALAAGPIRVRMGVHTGTPLQAGDGYVGVDVHRAARIAAAGHGGQVLVSASAAALVDGIALRNLGEHRLKDLTAPQWLYQLGDGHFPPLKTLHATNLPIQSTPLVGRSRELAEVTRLVRSHRLVTLVGPGGSGKTRLALQVATETVEDFPDGIFWVPLQAVQASALVEGAIASSLGTRDTPVTHISHRRLLLLVDNLEHLLPSPAVLGELLGRTPHAKLLVTSREPLRIAGEHRYSVGPLPGDDAVTLFTQRARAVEPGFTPTPAVSNVCRRLDGLPLAIELAAGRVNLLGIDELLARLDLALAILTRGAADAPERQRTLRATIEWSHRLLVDHEQELFRRLAVFSGSFDLPAAEGICAAHLDTLHSLVDKSLLGFEGDRFTMLETIREFAAERLWASPEAHDRRRRHARHFADAAERMEVEHSTMQGAELRRLWTGIRADYDNLRVAFDWAVEQRERELALRLVGVGPLTYAGTVPDGQRLVEVALALEGNSSMRAEAAALQRGGQLAYEAEDIVTSLALLERSLAGYRILGDVESILDALTDLAQSEAAHGEVDDARAHLHEAIERSRQISSTDQLAAALHSLGELERDHGRHSISAELLEEALELWERGGHLRHAGETRHGLADLRLAEGEHKAAVQLYRATLVQCRNEDNKRGIAYALGGLAAAAAATGQLERAGRLWGVVEQMEAQRGAPLESFARARYRRFLATLDAETLEHEIASGRALPPDEAIELALGEGSSGWREAEAGKP